MQRRAPLLRLLRLAVLRLLQLLLLRLALAAEMRRGQEPQVSGLPQPVARHGSES